MKEKLKLFVGFLICQLGIYFGGNALYKSAFYNSNISYNSALSNIIIILLILGIYADFISNIS